MSRLISTLILLLGFVHCSHFEPTSLGSRDPAQIQAPSKTFQRLNADQVLFGVEYSFQDEKIINEKGRMTFKTKDIKSFFTITNF